MIVTDVWTTYPTGRGFCLAWLLVFKPRGVINKPTTRLTSDANDVALKR